jgi:hypothetical protein
MQAGITQVLAAEDVLNDADHHADAGRRKPDVPVDPLTEIPANQRRDERAEVDAHVENRIPRIAPHVVGRIQPPDDHADVTLEQARTDDDQHQAEIERGKRWQRHAEMPSGDEHPAVEHGAPRTDEAIGDPAAGQRGHVHHRGVEPVDGACRRGVESQSAGGRCGGHEQDEQRAHAVVTEALPHLGEEQRRQPAWMAEECSIPWSRRVPGAGGSGCCDL